MAALYAWALLANTVKCIGSGGGSSNGAGSAQLSSEQAVYDTGLRAARAQRTGSGTDRGTAVDLPDGRADIAAGPTTTGTQKIGETSDINTDSLVQYVNIGSGESFCVFRPQPYLVFA